MYTILLLEYVQPYSNNSIVKYSIKFLLRILDFIQFNYSKNISFQGLFPFIW